MKLVTATAVIFVFLQPIYTSTLCREIAQDISDSITADVNCASNTTWGIKSTFKPKAVCIGRWNQVVNAWYTMSTVASGYKKCLVQRWPTSCGESCTLDLTTTTTTSEICSTNTTKPYIEQQNVMEGCCSNLKICTGWMTSYKAGANRFATQYNSYKNLVNC